MTTIMGPGIPVSTGCHVQNAPPCAAPAVEKQGDFAKVLGHKEATPNAAPPEPPVKATDPGSLGALSPKSSPAANILRGIIDGTVKSESRIDKALAAAAKGKSFSPNELLILQAEVMRYSQTVDVLSRTADRVVGCLKQTLNTPV